MKVRVTLDVTDKDRLILGMADEGTFGSYASREFIVAYITAVYEQSMRKGRDEFDRQTKAILDRFKEQMDLEEA